MKTKRAVGSKYSTVCLEMGGNIIFSGGGGYSYDCFRSFSEGNVPLRHLFLF
jgi:hypothetical protein